MPHRRDLGGDTLLAFFRRSCARSGILVFSSVTIRCRDLVVAMIVARLITPVSKLATAKALDPTTAASSLGTVPGLGE